MNTSLACSCSEKASDVTAPLPLQHDKGCIQVVCSAFTDEEYKRERADPEEFERRYGQYGVHQIWRHVPLSLPCCASDHNAVSMTLLSAISVSRTINHTFY
jgi:hypothetical protein